MDSKINKSQKTNKINKNLNINSRHNTYLKINKKKYC